MLLRSASPKRQNLPLPNGYSFSSNALGAITMAACILQTVCSYGQTNYNYYTVPVFGTCQIVVNLLLADYPDTGARYEIDMANPNSFGETPNGFWFTVIPGNWVYDGKSASDTINGHYNAIDEFATYADPIFSSPIDKQILLIPAAATELLLMVIRVATLRNQTDNHLVIWPGLPKPASTISRKRRRRARRRLKSPHCPACQ
jgi:hypothetical protein